MKPHTNNILMGLCLAALCGPLSGRAATIWNGPLITFTQAAPYPNTGDRDQLTPSVSLTRANPAGGGTGGMFNGVTETFFTKFVSPANTEWAVGSLADYATLGYADWTSVGGGNPVHNLPGKQLVVHLISDDIYLSLRFTALSSAAGFSYTRSTPPAANVPPTVTIASPTNGASFTSSPANVPITANANDPDGSVTNVAFFDGGTFLGGTNNTPYTVTASLATGGHALTAVATDNLGLSTTSTVVNVTVSAANVPPSVSITNPVNNAVFAAPANVTIAATATVSSGSVTNVEFFGNGAPLGSDQSAPFSITTGNLAAGPYALTAVATAAGISATSSVVNITVVSPSPTVSITNPVNNAVFAAPANVTLRATATVSSGSVTNVEFFGNSTSLGSVQAAPFNLTTGNLAAGSYALNAVATAAGVSATSSVVNITVVSPVAISATAQLITNGQFSFDYAANPGLTYVVENSSNLVNWLPVATNVAAGNPVHFTDSFIPSVFRYYRVGRLPNP